MEKIFTNYETRIYMLESERTKIVSDKTIAENELVKLSASVGATQSMLSKA